MDMPPLNVWLPEGTKNYKIKTNGQEKKRITVGLFCSASVEKYTFQLIFPGAPNGRIFKDEC